MPLSQIEIERQLTQRRLDIENLQKFQDQVNNQVAALKQSLDDINTTTNTSGGSSNVRLPFAVVLHKFLTGINSSGVFSSAQPAFTDISGTAIAAQIPASVKPPATQTSPIRALNTVYQNTGVVPLYVAVTVLLSAVSGGASSAQALSDAANPPTTAIATGYIQNNNASAVLIAPPTTFIVLPNNYYKILSAGTATIQQWIEWQ